MSIGNQNHGASFIHASCVLAVIPCGSQSGSVRTSSLRLLPRLLFRLRLLSRYILPRHGLPLHPRLAQLDCLAATNSLFEQHVGMDSEPAESPEPAPWGTVRLRSTDLSAG
jgi:hypothetical protein